MIQTEVYTRASDALHQYLEENGLEGTDSDATTQQRRALAQWLEET